MLGYPFFLLSLSSNVFSLLHDEHFEADEKFLVELMNRLPHFIHNASTHNASTRVNESIFFFLVFFLEKSAFDLLVFDSA